MPSDFLYLSLLLFSWKLSFHSLKKRPSLKQPYEKKTSRAIPIEKNAISKLRNQGKKRDKIFRRVWEAFRRQCLFRKQCWMNGFLARWVRTMHICPNQSEYLDWNWLLWRKRFTLFVWHCWWSRLSCPSLPSSFYYEKIAPQALHQKWKQNCIVVIRQINYLRHIPDHSCRFRERRKNQQTCPLAILPCVGAGDGHSKILSMCC